MFVHLFLLKNINYQIIGSDSYVNYNPLAF